MDDEEVEINVEIIMGILLKQGLISGNLHYSSFEKTEQGEVVCMRIIYIETGKKPVVRRIKKSLREMQKLIGGHIEAIYPFNDTVALICNDEGKLMGLPLNRGLKHPETGELYEIIAGDFFICGAPVDSDEFAGLSDTQVETYLKLFHSPEVFMWENDKIISIKC